MEAAGAATCASCGAEIPAGSAFCPDCGAKA
ncbi:MAG: zinc-ribbon domain-containing protein [Actinobacteria bacterium]|nr:MAG: zinc-ribbon domain-containing protein [Actinomycetota bacterium]